MPRQYTFKTTKDTAWMEEYLNQMGRLQRSEFIRSCIASCISSGHTQVAVTLPPAEVAQSRPLPHREPPKKVVEENAPPAMTEVKVEVTAEKLENALDNLYN